MDSLANFDNEIEQTLNEMIQELLIPHFIELGMDATGEWIENIHAERNEIWGRDYTEYLVNGRPPGKFAPIAPLIKWAKAKFGYDDETAKKVAYAVNWKLKTEGTTYYQEGGTDLLEFLYSDEVQAFIMERLGAKILGKIKDTFIQDIKLTFAR